MYTSYLDSITQSGEDKATLSWNIYAGINILKWCAGAIGGFIYLTADPMHFFHCPSQGLYIRRHDHIRDAIIDQIGDAIRPEHPFDIGVEREPLVRAHLPPSPDPPPATPGGEEAMEVEADNTDARLKDNNFAYIEVPSGLRDLRERNIADKAAKQCRGDIGVDTDSSRLLVDVAVGDATAPSYFL